MKDCIGFLDSGVGGISVLKKAVELLPNENYVFFGDSKNAPYGVRELSDIRKLSKAVTDYLLSLDVKAIVIACNTITAAYAEELRSYSPVPVIGMEPAVKPASLVRKTGKVLALATKATLTLDKFSRLMDLYGEGVIPLEGHGFVELVEQNDCDSPHTRDVLLNVFEPFLSEEIDAIVLGCTHYPFLRQSIEKLFPGVPIFDGREGTVRQLERRLNEIGQLSRNTGKGIVRLETSGGAKVKDTMRILFNTPL